MSSNYHPIEPARLQFDDEGAPFSFTYGDVYHPHAGALGQAREVFMAGCALPKSWQGKDCYVIVETGFGLGHNFLTAWEAWRADPKRCQRLHFISVEKHPFSPEDLREAHQRSRAPADLSSQLCAQWPAALPGFHRLHFDEDRVTLTLLFGSAEELLPELKTQADAIFLDGFAPGKNPDMWSAAVFSALAELSHSDTLIATWSVSGWIRTGLAEAGFLTDKAPGFAGKRERLCGHAISATPRSEAPSDRRTLVIGAGLAGTAIAERLASRGWQVQLIDGADGPAQGASGNLTGAFRPLPAASDGRLFQLTRSGFLYGLRHVQALSGANLEVRSAFCGALHLARDAEQETKLAEIVRILRAPSEFVRFVDRAAASELAGQPVRFGGWYFEQGGWIDPPSLCRANIARFPSLIHTSYGRPVHHLQRAGGLWRALASNGDVLGEAPSVVLANAADARRLALAEWLPLTSARGQVSHLAAHTLPPLARVVCGQGYVTPPVDGTISAGASIFPEDESTHLRLGDHLENLDKLDRMLPGFTAKVPSPPLEGRVSHRSVSPDRMPMVGLMPSVAFAGNHRLATLPRHHGLYLFSALGARGLTWSSLLAEQLASQIAGDPEPLPHSLVERIDPARFLFQRSRGKQV